jgi:uncharacterized membrane protein
VNYYSEYLAEAGPEREREVIERLGPPQRVAAEIRADAALRELNSKTWLAEKSKTDRQARKERRRAEARGVDVGGDAYGADAGGVYAGAGGAGSAQTEDVYAGTAGGGAGAYEKTGGAGAYAGAGGGAEDAESRGPNMGESFSAAGLGAMSMLSMPVARPLAVLACVLGIIGLVISVIVVVALFVAAVAVAACGVATFVLSFMVLAQDPTVTLFFLGTGLALAGLGLVIGILNSMLGRAIFKGIANLSGRIRHKRVKVRKEIFNYNYMYAGEGPYAPDPQGAYAYTERPGNVEPSAPGPYTERPGDVDLSTPGPYVADQSEDRPPGQQQDVRVEEKPAP